MKNLSKYDMFHYLNETTIYEFPLLKNMNHIRNNIKNIKEDKNTFFFNFNFSNNNYFDPFQISFYINIFYTKSINNDYSAFVNYDEMKNNNFKKFNLNVKITTLDIDYEKMFNIILHELKHIYDLYNNINQDSFDKVGHNNELLKFYSLNKEKNKWIIDFLQLNYLAFQHEVDARSRMIYDKLKYLKIYDKQLLKKEFENTYMYKSYEMIKNFDSNNIVNNTDFKTLLQFTNDFIKFSLKQNYLVKTKQDLANFYLNIENKFKDIADKFLSEADKIIDELIIDIKPYMEGITSKHPENYLEEDYYINILKEMYQDILIF